MGRAAADDALDFTGERFTPECVREISYEHWHRYAWSMGCVDGLDVLDCACGEGYGTHLLASRARSVVGADVAVESVAHAQRRYARPGLDFVEADALKLPFEDRRFDAVVSFETLEHLAEHDELMTEFRRLLKPGGFLVLSSPDRKTYSDETGFDNEFHVRELYRDELEALLDRHFPNYRLYGQRLMFHSALWRMGGDDHSVQHLRAGSEGTVDEGVRPASEALYFIALAAADRAALPEPAALSLFDDQAESVYAHYNQEIRNHIRAGELLAERDAEIERLKARLAEAETVDRRGLLARLFRPWPGARK